MNLRKDHYHAKHNAFRAPQGVCGMCKTRMGVRVCLWSGVCQLAAPRSSTHTCPSNPRRLMALCVVSCLKSPVRRSSGQTGGMKCQQPGSLGAHTCVCVPERRGSSLDRWVPHLEAAVRRSQSFSSTKPTTKPNQQPGQVCSLVSHQTETNQTSITFSNGYLGYCNDEERSEMRYVMRIAELSESSNL